jgi:asparagine synthase (glutamine-hydrolysing)
MLQASPRYAYLAYCYSHTLGQDIQQLFHPDAPIRQLLEEQQHPFALLDEQGLLPERISAVDRYMYLDAKTSLPQFILMKSDLMAMANGLEVRCPFLDADLATFLFALPHTFKRRHRQSKWLLRQYLQTRVPSDIWAQKKAGFSAPFAWWLQTNPLFYDAIEAHLMQHCQQAESLGVNAVYLEKLLAAHRIGQADYSQRIWSAMILLSWFTRYASCPITATPL